MSLACVVLGTLCWGHCDTQTHTRCAFPLRVVPCGDENGFVCDAVRNAGRLHEDGLYYAPEDWEAPQTWNYRRHFTRAIAASECWPRVKFGLLESTAGGCPSGSWQSGTVRHSLRSDKSHQTSELLSSISIFHKKNSNYRQHRTCTLLLWHYVYSPHSKIKIPVKKRKFTPGITVKKSKIAWLTQNSSMCRCDHSDLSIHCTYTRYTVRTVYEIHCTYTRHNVCIRDTLYVYEIHCTYTRYNVCIRDTMYVYEIWCMYTRYTVCRRDVL